MLDPFIIPSKGKYIAVTVDMLSPLTIDERRQLLQSASLIYGSTAAELEINLSRTSLQIKGKYSF